MGDAATQCCVVVNWPITLTFVTCSGAVPAFVTVIVFAVLVVPMACAANVRLAGETTVFGAVALPVKT